MQVDLALNCIISCVFCWLFFLCIVSDNHAVQKTKQKVYDGTFMSLVKFALRLASKVDMPILNIAIFWTLLLEWFVGNSWI